MPYFACGLFDTEATALEASVYEFLTAGGLNSLPEALLYATEARTESISEARSERAEGWAYDESSDAENWGVHVGGSAASEPAEFNDDDINRAFDAVAARLRAEIAEDEAE